MQYHVDFIRVATICLLMHAEAMPCSEDDNLHHSFYSFAHSFFPIILKFYLKTIFSHFTCHIHFPFPPPLISLSFIPSYPLISPPIHSSGRVRLPLGVNKSLANCCEAGTSPGSYILLAPLSAMLPEPRRSELGIAFKAERT